MSLLMDALKRAERAREVKEGVDAQADDAAEAAIPELSLDPIEPGKDGPPVDNSVTGAGFSLEPLDGGEAAQAGARERVRETSTGVSETAIELFKLDDPPAADDEGEQSLELDISIESEAPSAQAPAEPGLPPIFLSDGAPLEDTSATLPSLKAVRESVDSYFDGTDSVSIAMEPVLPDTLDDTGAAQGADARGGAATRGQSRDDTTSAGRGVGDEMQAQRAAKSLFEAKQAQRSGSFGRFLVFVVLPLMLAAAAIFGAWYWVEIASAPSLVVRTAPGAGPVRALPGSTLQPRGSVAPTPVVTADAAAVPAATGSAEPSNAELVRRAREALAAGEQALASESADGTAGAPAPGEMAAADLSVKPPEPKIVEAAKPLAPKPPPKPPEPQLSDAQFEAALRDAEARLPRPPPDVGTIRIARNKPAARVAPRVQQAWDAYTRGDHAVAKRAYQSVLRNEPGNRDALLGIAAVATVEGDLGAAAGVYQRLLQLNPQDSVARAALFNLGLETDAQRSVNDLKSLLAAEPHAAHLYFSLGNALAQQARWPEAQEAYFSAFRYDSANADYAFNLAVSLDHLRQRDAALQYYRQALALADGREVSFAPGTVRQRIGSMTGVN